MDELQISINDKITALSEYLGSANRSMLLACEVLVDLIDNCSLSLPEISDKVGISCELLGKLERVGRHQMHQDLLFANYAAASCLKRLPYSEQKRCIEDGVKVLVPDGNGGQSELTIPAVSSPSKRQCKQVFSKEGVRSLGAQRAYLLDIPPVLPAAIASWKMVRGEIIIPNPCTLGRKTLLRMLQELE